VGPRGSRPKLTTSVLKAEVAKSSHGRKAKDLTRHAAGGTSRLNCDSSAQQKLGNNERARPIHAVKKVHRGPKPGKIKDLTVQEKRWVPKISGPVLPTTSFAENVDVSFKNPKKNLNPMPKRWRKVGVSVADATFGCYKPNNNFQELKEAEPPIPPVGGGDHDPHEVVFHEDIDDDPHEVVIHEYPVEIGPNPQPKEKYYAESKEACVGVFGDKEVRKFVAKMEDYDVPIGSFYGIWKDKLSSDSPLVAHWGVFFKGGLVRVSLPTVAVCEVEKFWAHKLHDVKMENFLNSVVLTKKILSSIHFDKPEDEVNAAMYIPVVAFSRRFGEMQGINSIVHDKSWHPLIPTAIVTSLCVVGTVISSFFLPPVAISLACCAIFSSGSAVEQHRKHKGMINVAVTRPYVPIPF